MNNQVKIGIIGIGNMGSVHAKNIYNNEVENMQLGAVCDIEPTKQAWVDENVKGIPFYQDYKEMIENENLDAILIAVPHYFHPEMAIYGFSKGLHVISEKPAGVYTKQVEAMNEAAKKSGKVFGIMYNQRTNPMYQKARELVKSGALGELKRCIWIITDWYRTQSYYDSGTWRATWAGEGGGVLINQCPHNLDLWQWIFGMPTRIRATCQMGKWHDIEVEDEVTAYAEYANGSIATFITTTGETPGTNRLEITGDKGKLVIEDGKMHLWQLKVPEREWCVTCEEGFKTPEKVYTEIKPEGVETGHNGILRNFVKAILQGEKLLAPGYEGINGLTISNAIHLSSFTNDWVELPIDKELYLEKLNELIKTSKTKDNVVARLQNLEGTY
ncbi:Gfo/Idh/MocA family oxidoreductase [Paludicola sp. MB14-C6]|uniref:Gfo/Idh/MocA family protein n=1 Tax=Paludihabitans sp. MB14-C6 TaxID=3070656 RepID=UPI0027DC62FD|nr:Gfo/Idh/MocA family oxidoreductase [Paludicola sp. MB14-C6]WMJ23262.1 Gfo/Idh/MocA family oxidoreductase [Paludicola sp. MB14-C6]